MDLRQWAEDQQLGQTLHGVSDAFALYRAQASVTEVNVSYYCFRGSWLKEHVSKIAADNAAGEYYLTDLVATAFSQGERIVGVPLRDVREGLGVNTPAQLEAARA